MERTFNVDLEIYESEVLSKAIQDFSDVATIKQDGSQLKIIGTDTGEISEIFNELMNYYLGLINN